MRLIDVRDFVKNKLSKYDLPSDSINACDIRLMLLEQPTVEAIPVEWLEDYVMGEYKDVSNYVYTMIDNWRKENEAN